MPGPRRRDIVLRDNADFFFGAGFFEPDGGRAVDDLVLTNGSPIVTSASAAFTTGDDGKKLAVVQAGVVTDGATMTYVDAETVSLSENASVSMVGAGASIRALNCSAFTSVGAHVKYRPGINSAVILELDTDDSRNAVGLFSVSAVSADIAAAVKSSGHWDWLMDGPDGHIPWYEGRVTFKHGETNPDPAP